MNKIIRTTLFASFFISLMMAMQGCSMSSLFGSDDSSESHYAERDNNDRSHQYESRHPQQSQPQRRYYDVPDTQKESYHFSHGNSPRKHQDRDTDWVRSQKPGNYTIEVGTDERPATVADKLHQSPKSKRSAQIRHKKDDKTVYTGVYGTYKDEQEAKEALSRLPANVQESAKVRQWQNVQTKVKRTEPIRQPTPVIKESSDTIPVQ